MKQERLVRYLDRLDNVPACALLVMREHIPLLCYTRGCAPDTMFWLYSATKIYTATAALRLAERGALPLNAPVGRFLPEYADLSVRDGACIRPARTVMTVWDLLTMCAGLSYDTDTQPVRDLQRAVHASTREFVRAFARTPLLFESGERFEYSLCHDVLAAVIETVSGKSFGEFLKDEILGPLEIRDLTFHPSAEQRKRLAPQYEFAADGVPLRAVSMENSMILSDRYESGGAGLCATAAEYAKLTDALANGGMAANGYCVLRRETIDKMRADCLTKKQRKGLTDRFPQLCAYSYGLGVRTRIDRSDGGKSPLGSFGWDGAAGAFVLIDPENRMTAVYVQHILNWGGVYNTVHPRIRNLIYESL